MLSPMRRSAVPVPALLAVTMLFWGAAFSVTDVALDYTTPGVVACLRALLGAAVLLALLPLLGGRLPRSRWLWCWAAVAGAGAVTLSLMGLSEGTSRAGPAVAAVLLNSAPFFVAIIGRLALDERITALRAFGLVVGFAGVALIILSDPGDVGSGSDLIIGCALTLVGAVGYACGGLAMRYVYLREPDVDVVGFSVAQFVCGGVLLIPYALFSGDPGGDRLGQPRPLVVAARSWRSAPRSPPTSASCSPSAAGRARASTPGRSWRRPWRSPSRRSAATCPAR